MPSSTPTSTSPLRRRRLIFTLVAVTVAVLLVDQLSKAWAVRELTPGERTDLVGNLLGIQLVFNPGAALSIATGMTWLLTLVAVVVVVVIVRASRKIGSALWAVSLGLLLGGAMGNLVDRMVRDPGVARGHVVDFIAYGNFFVGNVADIAIVVAAVLIVLAVVLGIHLDGTRDGARELDVTDHSPDEPAPAQGDETHADEPHAGELTEDEAQAGA